MFNLKKLKLMDTMDDGVGILNSFEKWNEKQ